MVVGFVDGFVVVVVVAAVIVVVVCAVFGIGVTVAFVVCVYPNMQIEIKREKREKNNKYI